MKIPLQQLLKKNKQPILKQWQETAFSCRRITTSKKPQGRFSDPLSYTVKTSTEAILEWLLGEQDDLNAPLQEICRLKAVEASRPAEALGFIFALKQIIRQELADEPDMAIRADELWQIDQRIDEIALLAFAIYSDCRAKIYELKINEIKRSFRRGAG